MLNNIINEATVELKRREEAFNDAQNHARNARRLSKEAILLMHRNKYEKAKRILTEAANHLKTILYTGEEFPIIHFLDSIEAAEQEYAEAQILFYINTTGDYPIPKDLNISQINYVLGLADVPGELRRQILDHLRKEDLVSSENKLETMEVIYHQLMSMNVGHLLKGLRRKIDIIRSINERTRAEITLETSRQKLTKELKKLGEKL
jgi:translin